MLYVLVLISRKHYNNTAHPFCFICGTTADPPCQSRANSYMTTIVSRRNEYSYIHTWHTYAVVVVVLKNTLLLYKCYVLFILNHLLNSCNLSCQRRKDDQQISVVLFRSVPFTAQLVTYEDSFRFVSLVDDVVFLSSSRV